jgi:LPXTG-motif cell wall-anchored protein
MAVGITIAGILLIAALVAFIIFRRKRKSTDAEPVELQMPTEFVIGEWEGHSDDEFLNPMPDSDDLGGSDLFSEAPTEGDHSDVVGTI